ncbi:MAG TPA: hypothetical protein PL181_04410 [bacterium]|nr:hypothetical protein [bacterium]
MSIKSRWNAASRLSRILLGVLLLLALLEIFFDLFEILIGQAMLWTNDKRPKVGRLWTEEERDRTGQQQASTRIDSLRLRPTYERYIHSFDDLVAYVTFKSGLQLTRDEFLALYRQLPGEDAGRLMEPSHLRELADSADWNSIRITRMEDRLQLLFVDSFGQPLRDAQALILTREELLGGSQLNANPLYAGRILPGPLFAEALESLPAHLQLQVINDPQKWSEWRQRLTCAAIAPVIRHNTIMVALELTEAGSTTLQEMEASELAVGYLIKAINDLNPDSRYVQPEKEENHE